MLHVKYKYEMMIFKLENIMGWGLCVCLSHFFCCGISCVEMDFKINKNSYVSLSVFEDFNIVIGFHTHWCVIV